MATPKKTPKTSKPTEIVEVVSAANTPEDDDLNLDDLTLSTDGTTVTEATPDTDQKQPLEVTTQHPRTIKDTLSPLERTIAEGLSSIEAIPNRMDFTNEAGALILANSRNLKTNPYGRLIARVSQVKLLSAELVQSSLITPIINLQAGSWDIKSVRNPQRNQRRSVSCRVLVVGDNQWEIQATVNPPETALSAETNAPLGMGSDSTVWTPLKLNRNGATFAWDDPVMASKLFLTAEHANTLPNKTLRTFTNDAPLVQMLTKGTLSSRFFNVILNTHLRSMFADIMGVYKPQGLAFLEKYKDYVQSLILSTPNVEAYNLDSIVNGTLYRANERIVPLITGDINLDDRAQTGVMSASGIDGGIVVTGQGDGDLLNALKQKFAGAAVSAT